MERLTAANFLLAAGLVLTGCDFIDQVNSRAYLEYNNSRWRAVVAACAEGRDTAAMPAEPPIPRVCQDEVELAYQLVPQAFQAEHLSWRDVTAQSEVSIQFVAEMLNVLVGRDVYSIEKLAPQIDKYFDEQMVQRQDWGEARGQVSVAVEDLKAAWAPVWPNNGLVFDLEQDVMSQRQEMLPELTAVRQDALEQYHTSAYERLAATYLFYKTGEGYTGLEPHVPQDCEDVAAALNRLEAALLVRYALDNAIENDVELVQEIGLVDLSQTPWDEIKIPKGKYAAHRVNTALARLKMLKYIDALLTQCLDVLVYDVELEWWRLWPGHDLETNIFAYAGLPKLEPEEK